MHCIGGQPLVSVLFVAVLITLFLLKTFSLLVSLCGVLPYANLYFTLALFNVNSCSTTKVVHALVFEVKCLYVG